MLLKMLFKMAQRDEKQVIYFHKISSVTTKVSHSRIYCHVDFHFKFFEQFLTVSSENSVLNFSFGLQDNLDRIR